MESKSCSIYNHGVLLEAEVDLFVTRNRPTYFLVINKWMLLLPDSDALVAEDKEGYRYERVFPSIPDHYVFKQL